MRHFDWPITQDFLLFEFLKLKLWKLPKIGVFLCEDVVADSAIKVRRARTLGKPYGIIV
jgi:hypothetical protein